MILPYFILSHLIGDFVLQPSKLVKWKMHSIWGVGVHVLIHLIVSFVIFMPFFLNGHFDLIYPIIGVNLLHFFIDHAKISYDLKHDSKVRPFIIDQILHVMVIMIAVMSYGQGTYIFPDTAFYHVYTSLNVIAFIAILIFLTEVYEIYKFQLQREKNKKATLKMNMEKVSRRVIIFTLVYVFFMILTFGVKYF